MATYYHEGTLYFTLNNEVYHNELSGIGLEGWRHIAETAHSYAMTYDPEHFRGRSVKSMANEFRGHYDLYQLFGGIPGIGEHLAEADVGGLPADLDSLLFLPYQPGMVL